MKVVIEIDLPDGQEIPSTYQILKLTDPNWHAEWWHIEDVQSCSGHDDLTDEEAREVLVLMNKYSDCNVGINWDSIDVWCDWVKDGREAKRYEL